MFNMRQEGFRYIFRTSSYLLYSSVESIKTYQYGVPTWETLFLEWFLFRADTPKSAETVRIWVSVPTLDILLFYGSLYGRALGLSRRIFVTGRVRLLRISTIKLLSIIKTLSFVKTLSRVYETNVLAYAVGGPRPPLRQRPALWWTLDVTLDITSLNNI